MEMKSSLRQFSAHAVFSSFCTAVFATGALLSLSAPLQASPTNYGVWSSSGGAARFESTSSATGASRWQGPRYHARPSSNIGVSIYSGPSPYYPRYREHYPYYSGYGGPIYVSPPPVIYTQPPIYYSSPAVYYGSLVLAPRYEYAQPPRSAPAVDTRVLQVQENLRRLGYYKGSIDGFSGSGTRTAIRAYQVDRGLPVTGRIDRDLLQDLGL